MARSLEFSYQGTLFEAALIKVERAQLYGSVTIETNDSKGERCAVATLASDGKTLIPRGGTALGYVNPSGDWVNRDQLQPVDLAGEPLEQVASSFDAPIVLDTLANAEEFLDHSARLTYRLDAAEGFPDTWLDTLRAGATYRFGFSYRGGVGHDPAFVFADEEDNIWLLITDINEVQFVGLEQAAICAGEHIVDEIEDDEQSLDFGML